MKRFVTKWGIVNIVLGVALIALAIVAQFATDWMEEGVRWVVAAVIAVFSLLRFNRDYKHYKNKNAQLILVAELVLALAAAVVVIPAIGWQTSLSIGFVLYMRGFAYFLIMQLTGRKSIFRNFIIYMVVLTLGAYVLFSGEDFVDIIQWVIFVLIVLYGAFLLIMGIMDVMEKQKKKPKKEKKPKEPKEKKPKEPKEKKPKEEKKPEEKKETK